MDLTGCTLLPGLIDSHVHVAAHVNYARHLEELVGYGLDEAGDILPGYQADIVALPGEVDESFAALNDICFVMNDGVIIVG